MGRKHVNHASRRPYPERHVFKGEHIRLYLYESVVVNVLHPVGYPRNTTPDARRYEISDSLVRTLINTHRIDDETSVPQF
jgi:hypothetical protein